jgi:hypothetical protein
VANAGRIRSAVIAGGRNVRLSTMDYRWMEQILLNENIGLILNGACPTGVDMDVRDWAERMNFPVRLFPPDWDKYGLQAGPIRNGEMAKVANIAILFSGGRGTRSMREWAEVYELPIFRR